MTGDRILLHFLFPPNEMFSDFQVSILPCHRFSLENWNNIHFESASWLVYFSLSKLYLTNLFHCNFVDTLQILHWCSWGWNFRVTPAQNVHVYLWRSASALLSSGPSPLSQLHWLCNQIPLPLSAFSISLVVSYYKTSRLQNPPCNISSGLQQLAWACWRQSATWNWTFSESHRLTHSFCWAAEGCTRLK